MRVFIAEKPSVGRAIAAILPGPTKRHEHHIISGEANAVVWCAGHILNPCLPEDYDPCYKRWNEDDLPIVPNKWRLKVDAKRRALYTTIKRFVGEATLIIHAGDPDREGQLLVDEVLERIGCDVPVKRMLVSDLNGAALKKALTRLEDNNAYSGLRDAALGRGRADWVYGLNLTRLYTVRGRHAGHDGVLSVGRVQTPVLGLVVRRDREIDAFESVPFFTLSAEFTTGGATFSATWVAAEDFLGKLDAQGRCLDRAPLDALAQALPKKDGTVSELIRKQKTDAPPLPFSLPELQKLANRLHGLSPRKTADIAQSLYEKHQVITYPRSDCQYLPSEHWNEAGVIRDAIAQSLGPSHVLRYMIEGVDLVQRGACWNDSKVTAHHAIIPTGKWTPLEKLSGDEQRVYALIAHRYLLQFTPPRRYEQTIVMIDVTLDATIERFTAKGVVEHEAGWTRYKDLLKPKKTQKALKARKGIDDSESSEKALPPLEKDQLLSCASASVIDKQTEPPKPFTEASLLDAMTGIARFVEDPELKAVLKDTDGLGTPATQAAIIDTLYRRGFIERKGKQVRSTQVGQDHIDALPDEVTRPDMTARWEQVLGAMAAGEGTLSGFMADVVTQVERLTADAKALPVDKASKPTKTAMRRKANTDAKGQAYPCPDPDCSGTLKQRRGSKGVFWGCSQYREGCKVTRPDARGKPSAAKAKRKAKSKPANNPSTRVGATCPDCKKGKIQMRHLKTGNNAGKPFLGCSKFPTCRFFAWPQPETADV